MIVAHEVYRPGLDTMSHAAEDDTPMLKGRSRTAMITPTSKAKWDEDEGGVAGPAGRAGRAPAPSRLDLPLQALLRLERLR